MQTPRSRLRALVRPKQLTRTVLWMTGKRFARTWRSVETTVFRGRLQLTRAAAVTHAQEVVVLSKRSFLQERTTRGEPWQQSPPEPD